MNGRNLLFLEWLDVPYNVVFIRHLHIRIGCPSLGYHPARLFQTNTAQVAPHWSFSGTQLLSVAIPAGYEQLSDHNALAFQDPVARLWTFMISFSHHTGAFNSNTAPLSTRAHALVSLVFAKTGGHQDLNKVTSKEKKGIGYAQHSVLNGSLLELCTSVMQGEFNHQSAY